jgi:hypothetical protein
MNTRDILNKYLYPDYMQNVQRKSFPYYDDQPLATGVTDYFFFVNAPAPFLRNKQLPVTGSEVFFITGISAYPILNHVTVAQVNALNELLQQSFLEIIVDNRRQMKIPGMDFINYQYADAQSDQVVVTALNTKIGGNVNTDGFLGRKLPIPVILNSTSQFTFRLVTTGNAVYNGVRFRLVLHGMQLDKLQSFEWDDLKSSQFQQIPVTYYHTQIIANGNQTTFPLFANPALAQNLFSQTFPLSDIQAFSRQNIEVFVKQPDVAIDPATIWNSRITNMLYAQVDDRVYYDGDLQNMLSVVASFGQTLTTTPDLNVVNIMNKRQSYTLPIPLELPANSKVLINLTQPAASLGITGEFTVALRGIETRRVA